MGRELAGKVIIITGASSGIGAATALACGRAGMDVLITARRKDRLAAVAASVRGLGRRAETVAGDVTDAGMSERLLDTAEARLGRFDVVFANAGYGLSRTVMGQTEEELRGMFEVNFFAAVDLLKAAGQRLAAARRPGHLLMCSSCVAKFALPEHSAYGATKAAQNHLCSAMRLEMRARGLPIDVSSVHPITTRTEFFEVSANLSGRAAKGPPAHTPGLLVQSPERVARAVVRCLRRPCPEVWTSALVRTVAGFITIFPRFGDFVIARQAAKDERGG